MNILIDTHILLWSLFDQNSLKKKQREILLNKENDIFVSIISLWEISLKHGLGKLEIPDLKIDKIIPAISESGFELLDLSPSEAISFHNLPKLKNKDPFDRMLIWQSISNNYHFMTQDKKIAEYQKYGLHIIS